MLCGMWDLSSQTKVQTHAPCVGSADLSNKWTAREVPDIKLFPNRKIINRIFKLFRILILWSYYFAVLVKLVMTVIYFWEFKKCSPIIEILFLSNFHYL